MFYIRIAELNIKINNKYPRVEALCADYIIPKPECVDIEVSATDAEIEKEVLDSRNERRGYAECVCLYRNICKELPKKFNAYLLHSAVIEYEGRGYAFAAKSGTGKSTHISLWKKVFGNKVKIINGDKPIVRYKDGEFFAYGTPWCGKEGLGVNDSVPLKALCFIERGETNSITELKSEEAVTRVFGQILMPEDAENLDALFSLLDETLRAVPCYTLRCNMDVEAAEVAYNGMKNN